MQKEALRNSRLYQSMQTITRLMDRFYLDGALGLIPGGLGDMVGGVFASIHVYFAAFRLRSWSLTLAVLNNALRDIFFGLMPFFVGDIIDFFHRANIQNMDLIDGFINDDETVIREVNRKARQSALVCVLLVMAIVLALWLMVWLAVKLGNLVFL
ncbi:MAG: DUF4112 domain-containing protein [Prevotella sp.]|nr:DUF4112 domain-containing protein [Prevotella sp.]